jgi:hypothetical protein
MFGNTQVELKEVNRKLMARTEDGWNNNKWGAIEKFLVTFEYLERGAGEDGEGVSGEFDETENDHL